MSANMRRLTNIASPSLLNGGWRFQRLGQKVPQLAVNQLIQSKLGHHWARYKRCKLSPFREENRHRRRFFRTFTVSHLRGFNARLVFVSRQ